MGLYVNPGDLVHYGLVGHVKGSIGGIMFYSFYMNKAIHEMNIVFHSTLAT